MKKKILITHPLSPSRIQALSQSHQVDCISQVETKYQEVMDRVDGYDAILCIGIQADQQIMDKGNRLQIISNYGVGYDNIDVAYAKSKGIAVANTPISTSRATAEYTVGLIISLLRKITINDKKLRQGQLASWSSSVQSGNSLYGKTLGIFGMGRIGKEVALMAKAFGMELIYYSRTKLDTAEEELYDVRYVSFDDLMSTSDIVSIHAPYTAETHHIIDAKQLGLMKQDSWIINTARGGLIDHDALVNILESKKIKGAALDVFPEEPVIPSQLLTMDHVILSPHNGTGTYEDRAAMFAESFDNIIAFFEGREMSGKVC